MALQPSRRSLPFAAHCSPYTRSKLLHNGRKALQDAGRAVPAGAERSPSVPFSSSRTATRSVTQPRSRSPRTALTARDTLLAAPPYSELPSQAAASSSRSAGAAGSSPQQQHPLPPQQQQHPLPQHQPQPAQQPRLDPQFAYLSPRAATRQADRRAARRLISALACAFLIWLVMGAFVGGVVGGQIVRRSREARRRWDEGRYAISGVRRVRFLSLSAGLSSDCSAVGAVY